MKLKKSLLTGLVIICVVVMGVLGLVGCANNGQGKEIIISGSSSVSPLMEELAAEFEKTNSDIKIVINTSDSSTGIKDTQGSKNIFGMVSRDVKSSETGIVPSKIATDGIALIVNTKSAITNILGAEVYDLFTAGTAIQSGITAGISREAGSGTRDAFGDLIKSSSGEKLKDFTSQYASVISTSNSTGAVKEAIKGNATANTLGYISLGSLDDTVKSVQFEGVDATAENIKSNTYKLARPFNIVLKGDNLETAVANLSAEAKSFYDFIFSEAGQAIVLNAGYVSI